MRMAAPFGNPFTLNGYQIASPNTEPFVNDVGPNVLALQFPDSNIEIDLPAPASTVDLEILSGTPSPTPMDITAFDSSNGVVTTATAPADRTVYPVTLSGNDMVQVIITGGTGEGGIVKICSS
jgi:hypothetical protein